MSEVRSFQGGRLRMLDDFGRQILPLNTDEKACVSLDKGACFFAGKKIPQSMHNNHVSNYIRFGCHIITMQIRMGFFFLLSVLFIIELLNR